MVAVLDRGARRHRLGFLAPAGGRPRGARYARDRLDAEDKLRARYARGEIGEDEFLQRMQVLQDSRAG